MLIESLGRHFAVTSRTEAEKLVRTDAGFWNVISLHGPGQTRAILRGAKSALYVPFDDIANEDFQNQGFRAIASEDWQKMITFHDQTHPGPILVHCIMGMSRSTGVALTLIYRALHERPDAAALALDILMTIRPIACPNELVVRRGLETFLDSRQVTRVIQVWENDTRIRANAANLGIRR